MKLSSIRNFGIAAHIDAGKTTVSERMLFHSGVEHRAGRVDDGTTVMDWMTEERERGITITAAATSLPWREATLNLIDTPGHVDFTVEVERCMRVLDGAVLVIDAVSGVQAQSETVWRQMQKHHVPSIGFVNKCDRPGADYLGAIGTMRARLGAPAVPIQFPVFEDGVLVQVVDLISREVWDFRNKKEGRRKPTELPCPDSVAEDVGVLRSELIDTLAEEDDELLRLVLGDEEPAPAALSAALRKRVIEHSLVPVLCGAALRDAGVEPLMHAVVDYLPSPLDAPPAIGSEPKKGAPVELPPDPEGDFCCLAFKLHAGPHGDLTFVRVYSGRIVPGAALFNPRNQKKERVARILRMHADSSTAADEAVAGDIVALTGLKWTATGDTLCPKHAQVVLEELKFLEPVITRVVEPGSADERDKLRTALERLQHEDPSFRVLEDTDAGQWKISGMGELHLEVIEHRLVQEFHVSPRVGQPRVAYREAVTSAGRGKGLVDRELGGKPAFGAVELRLLPAPDRLSPSVGYLADCPVPQAFRAAVSDALLLEAQVGPRFGHPLVHAEIEVAGGDTREGRDSEVGFVLAAVSAMRSAMQKAAVVIEEPLMRFEIEAPAEFSSGIIADLNSRAAELSEVGADGAARTLVGTVPLSSMFGYSTAVRSLSQGRASFSMEPAGYRVVPEAELQARGLIWT